MTSGQLYPERIHDDRPLGQSVRRPLRAAAPQGKISGQAATSTTFALCIYVEQSGGLPSTRPLTTLKSRRYERRYSVRDVKFPKQNRGIRIPLPATAVQRGRALNCVGCRALLGNRSKSSSAPAKAKACYALTGVAIPGLARSPAMCPPQRKVKVESYARAHRQDTARAEARPC